MNGLKNKIEAHNATAAVIGLGYVGLPLAMEIVAAGFDVIGIDLDTNKIATLKQRTSYILDVPDKSIAAAVGAGKFTPTADFSALANADNELIVPELERSGLKIGSDFCVAFSPERIDPGNAKFNTRNTPKIVGGITVECTEIARLFYSQFIDKVIPVSSTKCAEMVKLLENTFRSVNIGMVNELALMCDLLGVDVYEVIDAAATKPFGFSPFYPGPGLGGHCIPIDPHYLAWKLKALNFQARFIGLAAEINGMMPSVVTTLVADGLNRVSKSIRGSKIMVLGVAYKKDVSDCRESPALDVMRLLNDKGAILSYNDPLVPTLRLGQSVLESVDTTPAEVAENDCVIILTDHSVYDFRKIVEAAKLVIDTRNSTKDLHAFKDRIIKLGAGNSVPSDTRHEDGYKAMPARATAH